MTDQEKIKQYGFFGSRSFANKWIVTAIAAVGCVCLLLAATDLFAQWPSIRDHKWELGSIGGALWLVIRMWLGHYAMQREERAVVQ